MSTIKLRDYQKEVVEKLKTNKVGLVSAATGSGKTVMMAESIENEHKVNSAGKTLILVHLVDLVKQTAEKMKKHTGLTVGQYYGELKEDVNGNDVTVACYKSMKIAIDKNKVDKNHFYSIKVDECHHVKSFSYQKVVKFFNTQILHGFTATPHGNGEKEIMNTFNNNLICDIGLFDLIKIGHLSDMKVVMAAAEMKDRDVEVIKTYNKEKFDKINEVCDEYQEKKWTPKAIHFFGRNKHFNRISDWNLLHDKKYSEISSRVQSSERQKALKIFSDENSKLTHLISNRCLNEGIDLPITNILVFHETSGGFRTLTQRMGRGLRIWEGNKDITTTIMMFIDRDKQSDVEAMSDFIDEIKYENQKIIKDKETSLEPIKIDYVDGTDSFIVDYKEKLERIRLSYRKYEVKCNTCGKSIYISQSLFNRKCKLNCPECVVEIKRMKKTKRHKIITGNELLDYIVNIGID